jgi:hypothetical protein
MKYSKKHSVSLFTSKEYQATTFIRGIGLNLIEHDIDPYTDGEELDQALLADQEHNLTSCHNSQLVEDISNYLGHELFMRLKQLIITKDEIVNLYVFYEDMLMANSFSNMSFADFWWCSYTLNRMQRITRSSMTCF